MTAAETPALPLSDDAAFSSFSLFHGLEKIAVGLSGGPDSMALCFLLSHWGGAEIHAFTVDHGLRADSADEARQVAAWVREWPHVTHRILTWAGDKPATRIMEEARRARYALMADACRAVGITHLALAHHRDDQAETFLIRLAAGSGIDGLSGMRTLQVTENGITLCRPFLPVPKEALIATCDVRGIPYVTDPSNTREEYLRPRLRASRAVLEEEGLSSKRLSVTAARLARARDALEHYTAQALVDCRTDVTDTGEAFDMTRFRVLPGEIRLRLILGVMDRLVPGRDYAPRMEKVEELLFSLENPGFKGRTLGGCVFALKGASQALWVERES